jgi:hypothetical protein
MKTSAIFILFIFLYSGLISCGLPQNENLNKDSVKISNIYVPVYSVSELTEKLELSFKKLPADSLNSFFEEWNMSIRANTQEYINQNDTIKAVFEVYTEFYRPFDLLKLGDWEWGNNLNAGSKYIAVQNKIFYSCTEDFEKFNWNDIVKDSIINFRPPLTIAPEKILYLTSEYEEAITVFLGTESKPLGDENIMNPSRPAGESEKRFNLIRNYIPVLHGHWGGYWHLSTHPETGTIIFNKNFTKAKIFFRVGYQGGEAILEKQDEKWKIKTSKATWIE